MNKNINKSKLSKSELAAALGYSKPYISKLVKRGTLVPDKDGLLELEASRAALELSSSRPSRNRKEAKEVISKDEGLTPSEKAKMLTLLDDSRELALQATSIELIDAKTRTEFYKGLLARFELEQKKSEYLPVVLVQQQAAEVGQALKNSLLGLSNKISGMLVNQKDQFAIKKIIDDEMTTILEELIVKLDIKPKDTTT